MKKYKATLTDWGPHDGGIDVRQDKYPGPETPRFRELFRRLLEKELDVIVSDNQICFTKIRGSTPTMIEGVK